METFINYFNISMYYIFMLLYLYQMFYLIVGLIKRRRTVPLAKKEHKYAFIVAARNESSVIEELLKSMHGQAYPKDKLEIFVVADNCTDNTAQICRDNGAIVYERFNKEKIGKGYALEFLFDKILEEHEDKNIEAYIIFDADNLIDKNYVTEINKLFDSGYRVCSSYRNSKNYDSNWISAGYSLSFLRECRFVNNPRMILKTSCQVSGTGFMLSKEIIDENNGWPFKLLTEDAEFSVDCIVKNELIGFAIDAKFYDEQPTDFKVMWKQRLRWAKGAYQVFGKYGGKLFKNIFRKSGFACYDIMMTLFPATLISAVGILVNGLCIFASMLNSGPKTDLLPVTLTSLFFTLLNFYATFYIAGLVVTITDWKYIKCSAAAKILYTFTFPFFMMTYIPTAIVAFFMKVEWRCIEHKLAKSIEEFR